MHCNMQTLMLMALVAAGWWLLLLLLLLLVPGNSNWQPLSPQDTNVTSSWYSLVLELVLGLVLVLVVMLVLVRSRSSSSNQQPAATSRWPLASSRSTSPQVSSKQVVMT